MHLLFVCTGNTCRSPMAHYLTKSRLDRLGLPWEVHSAGLYAIPGCPMSDSAIQALRRREIDGEGHESTILSESLVHQADYIFTMTHRHKQDLLTKFPQAKDKVYTLGRFALPHSDSVSEPEDVHDIVDPFGASEAIYESCALMLEQHIDRLVAKIIQESDTEINKRQEGDA